MRFLSSRRRHPAAKPLTLLLALFLMGAVYSVVTPAPQSAADGNTNPQVVQGKGLYDVTCSSCHGLNGEGSSQAPSLIGVGAAAVDFQMGTRRMPMAKPAAQAPRNSAPEYTQGEIDAIGAYVASLGAGPAVPEESKYSPAGLSDEEIARGGELFRTNCSACHNIEGRGGALPSGAYAPSLQGVSSKHIYEALRTGPQQMPLFSEGALPDQDVKEIIGYLSATEQQPQHGGLALGGIGPVAEGFWGWILGIGGLVLVAMWLAKKGARAR
ncbi:MULTISPECIES: cytochrome bc1 complex diheme cytochrome c subunit [unclassified Luteococcus]|uniref:cytochrome bc1 complex diheme cytochrome c subunit n=1 Tax=unclassified Luteococcus TaxID=2639923 RepID=UPI00313AA8F1